MKKIVFIFCFLPFLIPGDHLVAQNQPEEAEQQERIGNIEVDLMVDKNHKYALLVSPDRATLLTKLQKVSSKQAEPMAQSTIGQLPGIPSGFIKTLTFDQDKGTVENRIWVMRRVFPKGTDLQKISRKRIKTVEEYLNFRPIRKFDNLNPTRQSLKHRCVVFIT